MSLRQMRSWIFRSLHRHRSVSCLAILCGHPRSVLRVRVEALRTCALNTACICLLSVPDDMLKLLIIHGVLVRVRVGGSVDRLVGWSVG